jgi:hypothetical protein
MRKELQGICEQRKRFTATFKRFGSKTNWHGFLEETILLVNVKDENGKEVADHIWFHCTKGFEAVKPLSEGDMIEFFARVKSYEKGYVNHRKEIDDSELDYKLNNPTKIRKIENGNNNRP